MTINPCVPDEWKEFKTTLKWKNANYNINYKRTGKRSIKLLDDKKKKIDITNQNIILEEEGEFEILVEF